jgi:hypothetical protein
MPIPTDGRENALRWVIESARDEFNAERVEIWLWDPSASVLRLAAGVAADEAHAFQYNAAEQVHAGEGLLGKIVEERVALIDFQPVHIEDGIFPARTSKNGDGVEVYFAGYPLNFRDDFIGVMACYTREPVKRDMQASWWVLGNAAGIALYDALLLAQRDQTIRALSSLLVETQANSVTRSLASLLEELSDIARAELACDDASIVLIDRERREQIAARAGQLERRALDDVLAGEVSNNGREMRLTTDKASPRLRAELDARGWTTPGALLVTPIRDSADEVIAVLQTFRREHQSFSPRDEQSSRALAKVLAVALHSARSALRAA